MIIGRCGSIRECIQQGLFCLKYWITTQLEGWIVARGFIGFIQFAGGRFILHWDRFIVEGGAVLTDLVLFVLHLLFFHFRRRRGRRRGRGRRRRTRGLSSLHFFQSRLFFLEVSVFLFELDLNKFLFPSFGALQ